MSKKKSRRIFRPGKGKAFLHFFVGETLLLVLCVCIYLFVLQGTIELPGLKNLIREKAPLTLSDPDATPRPTKTPEPTPSPTPVPETMYSPQVDMSQLSGAQTADSAWLKTSLFTLSGVSSGEKHAIVIQGHAYLEGMDAQGSSIYLLLENADTGECEAAFLAERTSGQNGLSFEEANGVNLDQAYYRACLDVTGYRSAPYRIRICVINGERMGSVCLDSQQYHFYFDEDRLVTAFQ